MRARFRDMRTNHGKCTIEVDVDDIVEIDIGGDTGRIRTLAGAPGAWRRFECSGPIPAQPNGFRFQGVNGRGRVQLLRDPRQNRGIAVIRIEDPKGGRDGYTFDLEWQNGPGSGPPPVFGRDGRDDRDRDRGERREPVIVQCNSDDGRRHHCGIDTSRGVRLSRQRSGSACTPDYSWGFDQRGIWVDRGCRADFEVGR